MDLERQDEHEETEHGRQSVTACRGGLKARDRPTARVRPECCKSLFFRGGRIMRRDNNNQRRIGRLPMP